MIKVLSLKNGQSYDCVFAGKTENNTAVFVISNVTLIDAVTVFSDPDNTETIIFYTGEQQLEDHVFEGYTYLAYCANENGNVRIALRKDIT